MADILDYLSNNWSQLLGIGPAGAEAAASDPNIARNMASMQNPNDAPPPPPPQPPPQSAAPPVLNGGALGSPTPVQTTSIGPPPPPPPTNPAVGNSGAGDFGPNMSFDQRAAPVQADIANGTADAQGPNYTDFSRNPNQPNPAAAGGGTVPAAISGPGAMMPRLSPSMIRAPNGGGPSPAPPPPASAINPAGGPPITNTSGGLASSMGLGSPQNNIQVALSGLGRGLSAVGAQRPGATGAASFAAGAGGALQGGVATQIQQEQMARQQQNDLFNQKSTAFKDWMQNNIDTSRAKYFDAFAKQKAGGAAGSNAWQATPYGRAQALETMLDNWENREGLRLKSKWAAEGSTPEQVQADLDNLKKQKDQERARRAPLLGIDPDEHLNGTSPEHPFDFNKLSPQQRLDVPDSAYYKYHDPSDPKADKNGDVIKQRDWLTTPPYEGWQSPGAQPSGQPQSQSQGPSPYEVMM
jgi:hypothetical protein